jgi:hypothetical protein
MRSRVSRSARHRVKEIAIAAIRSKMRVTQNTRKQGMYTISAATQHPIAASLRGSRACRASDAHA